MMSNVINSARLDIITVKPYIKQIILSFLFLVVFGVTFNNSVALFFMMSMLSIIAAGYPFSISEKNNMQNLYGTIAIKRRDLVYGRYIFSGLIFVIGFIISAVVVAATVMFMHRNISREEMVASLAVLLLLFSFITSIQLPVFFKFGYSKARLLVMIPFMLLGALGGIVGAIGSATGGKGKAILNSIEKFINYLIGHSAILFASTALLALAMLAISCAISVNVYRKKEI